MGKSYLESPSPTHADKAFRNVYGMMLLFFGLTRFSLVVDTYNRALYRLNTLMHICHVAILYRIAHANGQLVFSALLEKAELRGAWPADAPSNHLLGGPSAGRMHAFRPR